MRPQVGQLINNKYRLAKLLGDGGMGSVFEAQHEVLGSAVALKFLHPELARRQGLVQRFLQEARVSAKIQSPHVVKVTDVEQTPTGLPFMVMEFLKGSSLQALYEDNYRAGKRLSYEDALKYAVQILDGLEAAHEEGVVHRDLKPDNVMIVQGKKNKDVVKLLDFGIAKLKINGELYKGLTRPGVIMGTPEYMAPEQVFSADAVDARADIFSVAVMIFEMLAGRRPVGGDEAHQIAAAYLSGNIAKLGDLAPHVPSGLVEVIHKAMAADPKDRYGSIADFRADMDPYLAEVSKPAYTTPPPVVTPRSGNGDAAADRVSNPGSGEASNPRISNHAELSQAAVDLAAEASAEEAVRSSDHGMDGSPTDKVSRPWKGGGTQEIASISQRLEAAMGAKPVYDSTVEGQPFFPGSTAAYSAPTSDRPAPLRPGRTDIGGAVLPASTAMASGSYDRAAAGYPAPPVAPRRKRKASMGFGSIMLVGLLVAGAVVGGVYGFEHINKTATTTKKDEGKTIALPTNKQTQPVQQESVVAMPVSTPPAPTVPPVVTVATTPSSKPTSPVPTNPGPRPSASNPPPMIPSTLPLPNWPPIELPFPGMGGPSTTSKKPTDPAPQDPPKKPGGPKLEPIPQGAIEPAPQPQPQPSTTTPSNPSRPTRPAADGPKTAGTRKLPTRPSKGTTLPSNESSKTAPTKATRIPIGTRIAKPVH